MLDSVPHTARSFAAFYGISRERLSRIIADSLRDRGGVFALAGYGFFKAVMVDPRRMEIRPYTATRAEQESTPVYALKGKLADISAAPDSAASQPSAAPASNPAQSNPDAPSKYDLELQVLQERATALRQKNVLEQARLRDETVAYCSSSVQILLKNLRADIDALNLTPCQSAALRSAIDDALSDLAAVLPSIIAGLPPERIELELSARRADRISASRSPQSVRKESAPVAPDQPAAVRTAPVATDQSAPSAPASLQSQQVHHVPVQSVHIP